MNELVSEWVARAEADAKTAQREFAVLDDPNWDAVCFHAQQCVEKYLKALCQAFSVAPPRSHDLWYLASQLTDHIPGISEYSDELKRLSSFAVEIRYPGEQADRAEAKLALEGMQVLRSALRSLLQV